MQPTDRELVDASATELQREPPALERGTLHRSVLLLAQPDVTDQVLAPLLSGAGYKLIAAHNIDQAIDLLERAEGLEDSDGVAVALVSGRTLDPQRADALCERLREAAHNPLQIILLADSPEVPADAADAVVAYPWGDRELLAQIHSQLLAQQRVNELVETLAGLLGSSLLNMQLTQSLRAELETQSSLRQELVHRVSTHIAALRDYLELEVRRLPLGVAREAMQGVLYRVRNLSARYDVMAALALEEPVDFARLAARIGQGVKAMYSPRSKLPLVVQGQLKLPASYGEPLALALNELITNAYRHAFPGGRFGKIIVGCGVDGDTAWCSVADNGVGMPDAQQHSDARVGGVQLVEQLVRRALGGSCSWQSANDGTTATLSFPYPR
jgi:two-component sensor histidine kinase